MHGTAPGKLPTAARTAGHEGYFVPHESRRDRREGFRIGANSLFDRRDEVRRLREIAFASRTIVSRARLVPAAPDACLHYARESGGTPFACEGYRRQSPRRSHDVPHRARERPPHPHAVAVEPAEGASYPTIFSAPARASARRARGHRAVARWTEATSPNTVAVARIGKRCARKRTGERRDACRTRVFAGCAGTSDTYIRRSPGGCGRCASRYGSS